MGSYKGEWKIPEFPYILQFDLVVLEQRAVAGPTTRVTSSEFQKEYGRYSTLAKRQPLTITNHGRAELVVLDAEEYERLRRLDTSRRHANGSAEQRRAG